MVLLRIVITVLLCQLLLTGCSMVAPTNDSEGIGLEGCCGSLLVEHQNIV